MAWKNLKQLSLIDSPTSEHEALTELDYINELMDWEAIARLLRDIHGVLGIFRPKATKNAEALSPQGLQEGIAFPEGLSFTLFG